MALICVFLGGCELDGTGDDDAGRGVSTSEGSDGLPAVEVIRPVSAEDAPEAIAKTSDRATHGAGRSGCHEVELTRHDRRKCQQPHGPWMYASP